MNHLILSPSIMASNTGDWEKEISKVHEANIPLLHIDIMDGNFVPGKFGDASFVSQISKISHLINDVHIMIANPEEQIEEYLSAGSDVLTFHLEAAKNQESVLKAIKKIKEKGKKAGLSIKPATPVKSLLPYLEYLDVVLLMSVEPGKSGQSFMESSLPRIKELDSLREQNHFHYQIEVDGGINLETGKLVKNEGADIVVTGSYFFRSPEYRLKAEALMEI